MKGRQQGLGSLNTPKGTTGFQDRPRHNLTQQAP